MMGSIRHFLFFFIIFYVHNVSTSYVIHIKRNNGDSSRRRKKNMIISYICVTSLSFVSPEIVCILIFSFIYFEFDIDKSFSINNYSKNVAPMFNIVISCKSFVILMVNFSLSLLIHEPADTILCCVYSEFILIVSLREIIRRFLLLLVQRISQFLFFKWIPI